MKYILKSLYIYRTIYLYLYIYTYIYTFNSATSNKIHYRVLPSGKNQSACWMMGSMMATTWRDVAAAISARVLITRQHTRWSKRKPLGNTGIS